MGAFGIATHQLSVKGEASCSRLQCMSVSCRESEILLVQVPRLHALAAVKVNGSEELPIITYKCTLERQAQVAELRQKALQFLQGVLFGDKVAAEYVLLQLVSR